VTEKSKAGCVYLVGAGPGDPLLITVRGLKLLEKADVVVFDYLANPQLLRHCPKAQTVYVGKQASQHAMSQEEINQLLVNLAREGNRVVRLKGGDPFVFGRGGEECEALAAAGVKFEVVPGVTAAIAGPAYAGIPVTHREMNSSFTLVTGHEKEGDYRDPTEKALASSIDWGALAKLPCIAFYMGVKALPVICKRLMEHGMDGGMPAACIQWGTTAKQRTVVGTVSDLAEKVAEAKLTPPAITIVGRVVQLRETINWFESRPLFGQTIVVTRTRQQASELSQKLEELGARVIEAPTIELLPPKDWGLVDRVLKSMGSFDWVIFTSANGVVHTKERLAEIGLDSRAFGNARIAAVGEATAEAIGQQLNLRVDLCPQAFVAEALGEELMKKNDVRGKKFLLLRADIARAVLREQLQKAGASEVEDVAVYESKSVSSLPPAVNEALKEGQVNWVTFTSSSTAKNFVKLLGKNYAEKLKGVGFASIGPITTATLNELGLPPTAVAEAANLDGLVEAISSAKIGRQK
jgi:uroporphyrinogen III methyltransferase/synthase